MQYLERVIRCIADTTRYPTEILTPDSDLENDLGIDSVKRLEITIAIGKEFQIPAEHQTRESWVRTIQDVATWVSQVVAKPSIPVGSTTIASPSVSRNADQDAILAPKFSSEPLQFKAVEHNSHSLQTNQSAQYSLNSPSETPLKDLRNAAASLRVDSPRTTIEKSHYSTQSTVSDVIQRTNVEAKTVLAEPINLGQAFPSSTTNITSDTNHRGKIAFVTGSGHGVGNVIARLLAKQGITVIVNTFHSREKGEHTVEEIRREGGSAYHLWGSVANPVHVDSMFDQIQNSFGRLDYLVCNASDGKIGSFLELESDDWDRAFRTNVSGHYRCAIRASALMRSSGSGRIITLSSVGSHSYIRGLGSQGVVKAAVETMTRYLACELGPMGIRVNCVAGGPVYGELLNKFPDAPTTQQHWETMSPDGELCNPADLANTVLFLLGDAARGINGAVVQVDHGFSAVADGRSTRSSSSRLPLSMPFTPQTPVFV